MRYIALIVAVLLTLMLPSIVAAQTPDSAASLVVPAGGTYRGDIATVNQSIVIDGLVQGDVTSIRGSITVRGVVEGDVISLFGDVTFDSSAQAQGNVMAAIGKVNQPAPLELAQGRTVFSGELTGSGMASLLPSGTDQPLKLADRTTLSIVLALMALIGATLLSAIWPRSIAASSRVITLAPSRAIGLGMLWNLLAGLGMLIVTALLIFTLVGVAVLPFLLLVVQLPYIIGLAVIAQIFGQRLGQQGPAGTALGGALVLGPLVLLALISLPAALIGFYLLAGVGVGSLFLVRSAALQRHSAAY